MRVTLLPFQKRIALWLIHWFDRLVYSYLEVDYDFYVEQGGVTENGKFNYRHVQCGTGNL